MEPSARLDGYATVDEFAVHLGTTLSGDNAKAARMYLRAAEAVVTYHTGGRSFLPLRPTLREDVAADATIARFDTSGDRLPQAGKLLLGDELVEYGEPIRDELGVSVTLESRGWGGTTAAAHASATECYYVRGVQPDGRKSLYPGDFLRLVKMWAGVGNPTELTLDENVVCGPLNGYPYQWIERLGSNFRGAAVIWLAAVWGYSYAPPPAINFAVLRIAEEVFKRRGTTWTITSFVQTESLAWRFRDATVLPNDVQELLRAYRRVVV